MTKIFVLWSVHQMFSRFFHEIFQWNFLWCFLGTFRWLFCKIIRSIGIFYTVLSLIKKKVSYRKKENLWKSYYNSRFILVVVAIWKEEKLRCLFFFWKSSFSEKVTKIWKNLPLILTLLSKNNCFVKPGGRFFQILWPSHNVGTSTFKLM